MQCKERVDLLEALQKSRKEAQEAKEGGDKSSSPLITRGRPAVPRKPENTSMQQDSGSWLGEGTVLPVSYPDLSKAPPPLPHRPAFPKLDPDSPTERSYSSPQISTMAALPPYTPQQPSLPVTQKKTSRTPSPEKKGRVMLTTLRGPKDGKKPPKSPRASGGRFAGAPPASSKAAGLAWDSISKSSGQKLGQTLGLGGWNGSSTMVDSVNRESFGGNTSSRPESTNVTDGEDQALGGNALVRPKIRTPPDLLSGQESPRANSYYNAPSTTNPQSSDGNPGLRPQTNADLITLEPPTPPLHAETLKDPVVIKVRIGSPVRPKAPDYPSYRTEFPPTAPSSRATAEFQARIRKQEDDRRATSLPTPSAQRKTRPSVPSGISRRPVANSSTPRSTRHDRDDMGKGDTSESNDEHTSSSHEIEEKKKRAPRKVRENVVPVGPELASPKTEKGTINNVGQSTAWHERVKYIKKHLPKGVDESAAKQIFNEIVVQGDEVHWADVAGLEVAKKALKEAVVYPFLRPDLFMGLREPARGMLLFGPPGTGKTMLARAVATESRSTFFAISASSLTSKWLGESEKLVRALFSLAKALAPSIIFVDEIDSLLSSRGGSSEHESTRRIKTEFLIQWSDLQRAAAGSKQSDKEKAEGDASRVLVLAATNMPWAIDEAARRRFVRRQYIPLPEAPVREEQLRTLLGHQKHNLNKRDIAILVELTDGKNPHIWFSQRILTAPIGFSGSDITALAKDAAMGPLRSLGEALLYMSTEEIRPIHFEDFEASLVNIRPSVSKEGLQEYENWAKEFGERGG